MIGAEGHFGLSHLALFSFACIKIHRSDDPTQGPCLTYRHRPFTAATVRTAPHIGKIITRDTWFLALWKRHKKDGESRFLNFHDAGTQRGRWAALSASSIAAPHRASLDKLSATFSAVEQAKPQRTLHGRALVLVEAILSVSAVLNGIVAVPIMMVMMVVVTRLSVMGRFSARPTLTFFGWAGTALMAVTVVALFWSSVGWLSSQVMLPDKRSRSNSMRSHVTVRFVPPDSFVNLTSCLAQMGLSLLAGFFGRLSRNVPQISFIVVRRA
jgi:hypothetical protein